MTEFDRSMFGSDDFETMRKARHPYFGLDVEIPFPDRHPDIFRGWIVGPVGNFDDDEAKENAPRLRDLWEAVSVQGGENARRNMNAITSRMERFEQALFKVTGEDPEAVFDRPWRSGITDGYGVVYKQTVLPYGFARELLIMDHTRPDGIEAILRLGSDAGYRTSETVLDVRVYQSRVGSFFRRDEPIYAAMYIHRYPSGISGETFNGRFSTLGKNPYYTSGNFAYDIAELMEKSHSAVFG